MDEHRQRVLGNEVMERDEKGLKYQRYTEKEKTDPQLIQEYDFFVHGVVDGSEAAPPGDQSARGIKKSGPNRSGSCFSSTDVTEA